MPMAARRFRRLSCRSENFSRRDFQRFLIASRLTPATPCCLAPRLILEKPGTQSRRCQELTRSPLDACSHLMSRFVHSRLARMSNGRFCLIRDLGPVKGGKGLKHHEVVLELSVRGLLRFAASTIRTDRIHDVT